MYARGRLTLARGALATLIAALACGLAGCGGSSRMAAPGDPPPQAQELMSGPGLHAPEDRGRMAGWRGFGYPLAVGNRWDYRIEDVVRTVSPGIPDVVVRTERNWRSEIQRTATIESRVYHLQQEYDPSIVQGPGGLFFALRQDRSGLFERDIVWRSGTGSVSRDGSPVGEPTALRESFAAALAGHPHRAAFERAAAVLAEKVHAMRAPVAGPWAPPRGGPDPGEIALLRYPLYVGARWIVRDGPRFTRQVTGREALELPAGRFAAWRILGRSELYGPADRVTSWHAREGLVRVLIHAESDAVDDGGNVVGRAIHDSDQRLVDLVLLETTTRRVSAAGGPAP